MKNKIIAATMTVCAVMISIAFFYVLFPLRYYGLVEKYCDIYGVEQSTALAVIWAESKFEKGAISKAGAQGLMQLMPATAVWICDMHGEEYRVGMLFDPEISIKMGVYYLSYLQSKFEGDNVLAAYNAGEGNVRSWLDAGLEICFEETRKYIKKVNFAKKIYALRIKNK